MKRSGRLSALAVSTAIFTLSALSISFFSCSRQERTIITDVNVITMISEEVLESRDVVIEGGRIAAVRESGTAEPENGDRIIDGEGRYLIPGLADMHVHLYVFDKGDELPLFLANGVTTVKDCNGRGHILAFRDEIAAGTRTGPRIFCATHTIRGFEDEPWNLVGERYGQGYDAVKFYSYFDSRESFHRAMAEAKRLGAYTVGHIPYTVGLDGIIEEGMDEIAHVEEICWEFAEFDRGQNLSSEAWLGVIVKSFVEKFGSMPPEEMKTALAEEARTFARKIADKGIVVSTTCHYAPLISEKIFKTGDFASNPALKYLPPEYFINLGLGREKHQAQFSGIEHLTGMWSLMLETMLLALREEGVLITAGTDAIWFMGLVPGFSLHDELEYFVRIGFTPYEALKTATANAGEAGRRIDGLSEAGFGTIEAGKRADLVLLDGNPLEDISIARKISGVMAAGVWYPKEELQAMLEFDPAVHEAQLDVFSGCYALRNGDCAPLDDYIRSTECEEAKDWIYGNRHAVERLIGALHSKGMDDRAAEHFAAALKSNWDDANYINSICWKTAVEMKIERLYPEAIAAENRALELVKHAALYDTLAWLYALAGEYDKALDSIGEAESLDPDNKTYKATRTRIIGMKEG